MSAPDVSLERQKRRHHTMVKGLWWGAALVAIVAIVVTLVLATSDTSTASAITAGSVVVG